MVVIFVLRPDALENDQRLFRCRFIHAHGLESAFQCRVFLDSAVLIQRCGADQLQFASREGRLQDVACIHASLSISCANDFVDFIDEEDDLFVRPDFIHQLLHPFFELAADAGSLNERDDVQTDYFFFQ
ncbi:hypothetical protein SDC9_163836 [bioreactor metagenome]|uniref:Uncharacterized protein n=1 Tax=bioreactor metagenome TaxID=1076179 RepID=A0A645FS90_9ZZZZ